MENSYIPRFILILILFIFGANIVIVDFFLIQNKSLVLNSKVQPEPGAAQINLPNIVNPTMVVSPPLLVVSSPTAAPLPSPSVTPAPITGNICPVACVNLINKSKSAVAPSQKESSISIQTSGSTQVYNDWYTIPGSEFTFNKGNYPGAKSYYFQTNLSTDSTDRIAYARLYDATHGIGVTGSDITTPSTSLSQVQSGQLNPFSGNLTIRVQIRGLNGNLVTIGNSRIVVVY